MPQNKTLIVILGPTGVGKTDISIDISKFFDAPILSCDSRQMYKGMEIGTAVPSKDQLSSAEHHFIQWLQISDSYTCGRFEYDALSLLSKIFEKKDYALLVGGSGLYIDAVCSGIGAVPAADDSLRKQVWSDLEHYGLQFLVDELKISDIDYYNQADLNNHKRIARAVEVCRQTGLPYSSFRDGNIKEREFNIIKIGLNMPREQLYEKINRRVDVMMNEGLLSEVESLYPYREMNSLQTVGYREIFDYLDGEISLDKAVELIKRNSRRYAKRQLTWFGKDNSIKWFDILQKDQIKEYISNYLNCY